MVLPEELEDYFPILPLTESPAGLVAVVHQMGQVALQLEPGVKVVGEMVDPDRVTTA